MLDVILVSFLLSSSPVTVPYVQVPQAQHRRSVFCNVQEKLELNLYYTNYCPYSKKVLNYLNKIGKKIPLTNVEGNPQAKEYLKQRGGKLQVPCLFINGTPLYESEDIILWLSQHQDLLDPA